MSLKSLRENAGLTQHELGARLAKAVPPKDANPKYYQPRISSYETGRNHMPLQVAIAIAKILSRALKKKGKPHTVGVTELVE